jgi:uncharacterized protein YciI
MFIILLKFAGAKEKAAALMEAHKAWIAQGFAEGAFVLVGTIQPGLGGALIALGDSRDAVAARVADDPFVAEGVVDAEILEIAPGRVDERIALLGAASR